MSVTADNYFCQIPEWVLLHPELSPQAVRLYGVLNRYANKQGKCHPSRRTLAERTQVSVRTVARCLAELRDVGAIEVSQRFQGDSLTSSSYKVISAPPRETDVTRGLVMDDTTPGDMDVLENQSHLEPESFEPEKTLPVHRRSDPLFESVATVCDIDYRELTPQARGPLNVAVKQLRDLAVEPAEVQARAANWPHLFPGATLTPTALAKHWPQLARARAPVGRDRFAEMGRSLQQRVNQTREVNGGQISNELDQTRRGLPAG